MNSMIYKNKKPLLVFLIPAFVFLIVFLFLKYELYVPDHLKKYIQSQSYPSYLYFLLLPLFQEEF